MSDTREWKRFILTKLEKEIEASKDKAKSSRKAGDRASAIFNEGRIAGLITAARHIEGKL